MSTNGETIRKAREERGLSIRALARETGVHYSYISQLENGRRAPQRSLMLILLGTYLGVKLEQSAMMPAVPAHVRLILRLKLRRDLAEKLSLKAIKSERKIEAIVIGLIEAATKQWRCPRRSFAIGCANLWP